MNIVKVDATTSTNELARTLNKDKNAEKFCVSADFQTQGRGQLDNNWQSKRAENLMFTIVFNQLDLKSENQFLLNALVCIEILEVLKQRQIPKLSLKWPNDILSDRKKIGGVLIENTMNKGIINTSFVGIGLNVNQTQFESLPKASSLINQTGNKFDRKNLLNDLVFNLEKIDQKLKTVPPQSIMEDYKGLLFNFNTISKFSKNNTDIQTGIITDIALDGKLLIHFNSGEKQYFTHKTIGQVY